MLVCEYILKLKSWSGNTIKTLKSKYEFTQKNIEDILIENNHEIMSCEISKEYRLHSNTLHDIEQCKK
jgi:hypothetical protein